MPHQDKHAQATLLYAGPTAPLARVDTVALRSTIERLGVVVRRVQVQENDFVRLHGDCVDVVVAGFHRPFQLEHFRGVLRPDGDGEHQQKVLGKLAAHSSSLTVLVFDRARKSLSAQEKARICGETVDLLLATTSPSLVFWSDRNKLVTAAEAETALETGSADFPTQAAVQPRRPMKFTPPQTERPAGVPPSLRPGDIDLSGTGFLTAAFTIRPRRLPHKPASTDRPTHLTHAPNLSADVMDWFEGGATEPDEVRISDNLSTLRTFLALDESVEPRRVAETASGRASLYLMSATIAVFALPVGASMLTYNALSGGSFRATSHMMALTGIGLALTSMGIPNPAAALGF